MRTACIIVNYNDADTVLEQLERISEYSSLESIIVVDNASCDDSPLRLRAACKGKIRLIEADRNSGYGGGNNLGIQNAVKSGATHVLISNPDTEFSDETVEVLKRAFKHDERIAVAAPFMKRPGEGRINIPGSAANILAGASAWPIRPWIYELMEAAPLMRRIFKRFMHYRESFYNKGSIVYVGAVAGSLLMADVHKLMECNLYDEKVFLYCEENILGSRLRARGYKTALLPGISYMHRHSVSVKKSIKTALKRQKIRERSTMYYFRNYLFADPVQLVFSSLIFKLIRLETAAAAFFGRL